MARLTKAQRSRVRRALEAAASLRCKLEGPDALVLARVVKHPGRFDYACMNFSAKLEALEHTRFATTAEYLGPVDPHSVALCYLDAVRSELGALLEL